MEYRASGMLLARTNSGGNHVKRGPHSLKTTFGASSSQAPPWSIDFDFEEDLLISCVLVNVQHPHAPQNNNYP